MSLSSPNTPRSFGRYQVVAAIGQGGMSDVYLAVVRGDSGANKLLVVKQLRAALRDEAEWKEMFLDEARLAVRLNHPNVVQTYEVGQEGDLPFIAMEHLDGRPLNQIIRRFRSQGGLPLRVILHVFVELLSGLHHAHELRDYSGNELSVVHRDISPQNVFVTYEGQVKVIDFGIAKAQDQTARTRVGSLKGKLAYMAPEQARGEALDRSADLFAVGVMLWECLTGKRFWAEETDAQIATRLTLGDLPLVDALPEDLPKGLVEACHRALDCDRSSRYAAADEFRADLEVVIAQQGWPVTARRVGDVVARAFEEDRRADDQVIRARLSTLTSARPQDRFEVIQGGNHAPPLSANHAAPDEPTLDYERTRVHVGATRRPARDVRAERPWALFATAGVLGLGVAGYCLRPDLHNVAGTPDAALRVVQRNSGAEGSSAADEPGTLPTSQARDCGGTDAELVALELGAFEEDSTLTCDKQYLLKYKTFVPDGVTLTIEPGTIIRGDQETRGTLIVQPGGRLIAEGTREQPIVLTSARPEGEAKAGDWGGLIVLGRAPINLHTVDGAARLGEVEGLSKGGRFGGNQPEDDSGVLRYLRIEYAGVAIAPGNEINGLTLAGVGSGTRVDHIQVRNSMDDCFEFFGGRVDAHHLICENPGDDAFDADYGFQGRLQFLLALSTRREWKGNGFELDNDPEGTLNLPRTHPRVRNVTLCTSPTRREKGSGLLVRRSAQLDAKNLMITGFPQTWKTDGIHSQLVAPGAVHFDNGSDRATIPREWGDDFACRYRDGVASFKPPAPVPEDAEAVGSDNFFEPAPYVGAFRDRDDAWEAEWTRWTRP